MQPAQKLLSADLEQTRFQDLSIPLVNNFAAREIHTGEEARRGLFEQVPSPVKWTDSIRYLASKGVTTFYEIGPGAVLTGLLKNIDPALRGLKFGDPADWDKMQAS